LKNNHDDTIVIEALTKLNRRFMPKFIGTDGEELKVTKKAPKVKAVHPFGSSVLIELLTPDEILGTSLIIGEDTEVGSAPQAYVIELGPKLTEECGLGIGDRVLVQGKFVPVENTNEETKRPRGIVEIHNIKAVLEECCGGGCGCDCSE
jgi:hypothetical protein